MAGVHAVGRSPGNHSIAIEGATKCTQSWALQERLGAPLPRTCWREASKSARSFGILKRPRDGEIAEQKPQLRTSTILMHWHLHSKERMVSFSWSRRICARTWFSGDAQDSGIVSCGSRRVSAKEGGIPFFDRSGTDQRVGAYHLFTSSGLSLIEQ